MKVLMIADVVPGDARPGTARMSWLLSGLADLGVQTHLLSLRHPHVKRIPGAGPPPTSDSVTVVQSTCRERAGVWHSLLARDGGFERSIMSHPSQADAVRHGLDLIERLRPDIILSTAPPMRIGEVAYRLSLESGVPWVADWRDPASLRPLGVWMTRGFYRAMAERESVWLRHARVNVVTAPSYARMITSHHPGVKMEVVTNGWEPPLPGREALASTGTLLYSGSAASDVYGFAPKHPSRLSRRLRHRLSLGRLCYMPFTEKFKYHAWGRQALRAISRTSGRISTLVFQDTVSRDMKTHLKRLSLSDKTRVLPWASPAQARLEMAGAHVLWLCLCGTSTTDGEPVVCSKVFSYLASGRPIFAVLPPECDTAAILRGQPGVFMPDPNDGEALVEGLREALSLPPEKCFERDIDAYRTDRLVERMAGIFRRAMTSECDRP